MNKDELRVKFHQVLEDFPISVNDASRIVESLMEVLPKHEVQMVTDFHIAFSHPVNNTPTFDIVRHLDRHKYLDEEVDEIKDAVLEQSHTKLVDAYLDILYFAYGGLVEAGVADKTYTLFEEVHRANMSKLCNNALTLEQTKNSYIAKEIDVYTEDSPLSGYSIVKRKDDNKILKSIHFVEPQLEHIIHGTAK